jgi:hypothetical protein
VTSYVDLGEPDSAGMAVLLPGFAPLFAMPLLLSAAWAAIGCGWRARLVSWQPPESREPSWVVGELEAAVADHDGEVLVVGKSLATLATPYVADRGWDAVWFTPLLHRPDVAAAVVRHPGRQLLVGGTADESWVSDVAGRSGADVHEILDADHGLVIARDAVRGAEVHLEVTRRLVSWLRPPG